MHIGHSHKSEHKPKMPKEYEISNAPQTEKKTKRVVTMAKKHRGFGGKLKVLSFD